MLQNARQAQRAHHSEAGSSSAAADASAAACGPDAAQPSAGAGGFLCAVAAGFQEQALAVREGAAYISDPRNR
jgi:hypothetical protein